MKAESEYLQLEKEPVDLSDITRNILQLFAVETHEKQLSVTIKGNGTAFADRSRISQVI